MNKQDLIAQIERKRSELVTLASIHGLDSVEAVRFSQELDHLLNEFERTEKYKYYSVTEMLEIKDPTTKPNVEPKPGK